MEKIQLKQKDIKEFREKLYTGICPITGKTYELKDSALDHIHKLKSEESSITKGAIRNTLSRDGNCFLGKVENAFKRYIREGDIIEVLKNTILYLETGAYIEDDKYFIHPKEAPREPVLTKSSFNKLVKHIKEYNLTSKKKLKIPNYSKKLNKNLEKLFSRFNLVPELKVS